MNKQTKQILLFPLLIIALVWATQFIIDTCYKTRVENKFSKLFKHKVDAEIMIFGSSVAFHQVDPRIIKQVTGYDGYNMGFPGMFFLQYNSLIQEYLSYQKRCKVIAIACDFDNLGRNELITRPDLFLAYTNNSNVYNSLHELEPRKALLARYLPGYKLTLQNRTFYLDILLAKHYADTAAGFEALTTKWEVTKKQPFRSRYEEAVFEQFRRTIRDIENRGIKVVLLIPPVYEGGYKLILNAEEIKAKYRLLVDQNTSFLDYTSDTLCRSQSYFRNFTHLNGRGAELFSRTFAQDLLKIIHE